MQGNPEARGNWGSKLGFVLAAAGSAIGLGNIWRFPTETARNGGAVFVLLYLLCVILIGLTVMIAELAIGRRTRSDPVGAFKALVPHSWWRIVGVLGVLTGLGILSYYSVVAGWTLKYIWLTLTGTFVGADSEAISRIFGEFISDGTGAVVCHILFMAITVWIVRGGIEGGIEKAAKVLMPLLLLLLVLLVLRSVTLPGATFGLDFYLRPDFSKISFAVVLAAMGQAFFSLSVGMGAMITYGSYISPREDLASSALYVSLSDLSIAVLAGFAIFPALFSVPGLSPDAAGPGLIFVVLPNIFNAIPLGQLFGTCFFLLLAIAAVTSAISLLEVVVAYLIDQRGWQRKNAAVAAGGAALLLGIPSALGNGAVELLGGFLDRMDFLFGNLALVVGAFLICVFVGWKWGISNALEEIRSSNPKFAFGTLLSFLIRYLCPLAILAILAKQLLETFGGPS